MVEMILRVSLKFEYKKMTIIFSTDDNKIKFQADYHNLLCHSRHVMQQERFAHA